MSNSGIQPEIDVAAKIITDFYEPTSAEVRSMAAALLVASGRPHSMKESLMTRVGEDLTRAAGLEAHKGVQDCRQLWGWSHFGIAKIETPTAVAYTLFIFVTRRIQIGFNYQVMK